MEKKNKIAVIGGPTATGKSVLAADIAKELDGEVISFDSMQIYRGMKTGTAAPDESEMRGIKHHMIACVDPSEKYSCADYVRDAGGIAEDVIGRGKLPVFCGGTGLYIESFIYNNPFSPEIPEEIIKEVDLLSDAEAYEKLQAEGPQSAAEIHPNNVKRVKRALAIALGTGKTKTYWDAGSPKEPAYDVRMILLFPRDRVFLYQRINERVEGMFERGLEDEARALYKKAGQTASGAIGYKELFEYFDGKVTLEEAKETIKQNTRRYAKRQITWFSRYRDAEFFYINETPYEQILQAAVKKITE